MYCIYDMDENTQTMQNKTIGEAAVQHSLGSRVIAAEAKDYYFSVL